MKDAIKKAMLIGIGAAALSKAEIEKRMKPLLKKAGVNAKEGKEIAKSVFAQANKERVKVQKFAFAEGKKVKSKLSKVYEPKIKNLKKKVSVLEKKLQTKGRKIAKGAVRKVNRRL